MSTSSGKKPAQRHKNTFAFVPSKHNPKAIAIAAIEITGCCQKCIDIIQYKQRFGKYKSLTQPATCLNCSLKKITRAYHVLCQPCAQEKGVCAKCRSPCELVPIISLQDQIHAKQKENAILAALSERQRRAYTRKISNGDTVGAAKLLDSSRLDSDSDSAVYSDLDFDSELE